MNFYCDALTRRVVVVGINKARRQRSTKMSMRPSLLDARQLRFALLYQKALFAWERLAIHF